MHPGNVTLLVMAGGHSRRFGADDKLLAELGGQSLGRHIAARFAGWDWAHKRVVARPPLAEAYAALGYTVIEPVPGNGLGDNLALGARDLKTDAVLVLLADMPFVPEAHVRALLDAATSTAALVCTRTREVRSPPVLIGRDHFAGLHALAGDTGARALFAAAGANLLDVDAPPEVTADIDTPDDLDRWASSLR